MKPMSDSHMNVFYRKWWGIHTLWSVQLCGCLMDEQIAHSPRSLFLVAELSAIAGSLKIHFIIEACGERRVKIDFVGRFGPLVWTAQKKLTRKSMPQNVAWQQELHRTLFFPTEKERCIYIKKAAYGEWVGGNTSFWLRLDVIRQLRESFLDSDLVLNISELGSNLISPNWKQCG